MEIKVYLVSEVGADGNELPVALRLTFLSAHTIAKQAGNRRVTRWLATKDLQLMSHDLSTAEQLKGVRQHGNHRS